MLLMLRKFLWKWGGSAEYPGWKTGRAREEHAEKTLKLFNKLLSRSDEYGELKHKPSRPGCELRNLVAANKEDLEAAGFTVAEDGFLRY